MRVRGRPSIASFEAMRCTCRTLVALPTARGTQWRSKTFTPTEAAALAQVSTKQVRKELEHPVLNLPAGKRPRLPFSALVYLRAIRLSGLSLAVVDRARLYRLISEGLAKTPAPERVEFASVMSLSLGWVASEMASTLARFYAWKRKAVFRSKHYGG